MEKKFELPFKIELSVFDLRIDRNVQKIHYYLLLEEETFTFHAELFSDQFPETSEGEYAVKEGVFIYRRFIGFKNNICGVDIIYEVSEIDNQWECFKLYVEQRGVDSECTMIKFSTMSEAVYVQDILIKYMMNKFS